MSGSSRAGADWTLNIVRSPAGVTGRMQAAAAGRGKAALRRLAVPTTRHAEQTGEKILNDTELLFISSEHI